jgi:hypothetical protein
MDQVPRLDTRAIEDGHQPHEVRMVAAKECHPFPGDALIETVWGDRGGQ